MYRNEQRIAVFNLGELLLEAEEFCSLEKLDSGKTYALLLILEELVTNVLKYGRRSSEEERIRTEIDRRGEDLLLLLQDDTAPFNPLEAADPDIGLGAEEREIGGLGILLVRKKYREANYEYRGGWNCLRIVI